MKYYKHTLIAFFAIIVLGVPWLITKYPQSRQFIDNVFGYIGNNYTAIFFQETITIAQLQERYDAANKRREPKIRILVMPGHEHDFGGTEFGALKEREIVVDLAKNLEDFLENNSRYEVVVPRDKTGWKPQFANYFNSNWNEIIAFVDESKKGMVELMNNGKLIRVDNGMIHNSAPQNVALRLYGLNKWSNENDINIAIHLHFNDHPRSNMSREGKYSGISIYVPEGQYSNSTTARAIADSVFERLKKYNPPSNFPHEADGVIETQELIAIGSYNTVDAPSILIEYGYIYEPQIVDKEVRDIIIKDLAFQTYLGIQDFFGENDEEKNEYDTLVLPYHWDANITRDKANKKDVLALQTALIIEGLYPPENKTKNDCPRTGVFGPCTIASLIAFQNKKGIVGEVGYVGENTRRVLNNLYSVNLQ